MLSNVPGRKLGGLAKRQRRGCPWRTALILAVSATSLAVQPSCAQSEATSASAEAAILNVMQRTVEHGPAAASLRLRMASRMLETEAETAAEGPTIAWQSEGLDSSFDRRPNAADYLRLGKSFNYPWLREPARDLRQRHNAWAAAATRADLLELAAANAKLWLEWAAAEAELALSEARQARVDRALTVQQKKFELGEVAGAEVEQLRLEQARDKGSTRRGRARVRALETTLAAHLGGEVEAPGSTALDHLIATLQHSPRTNEAQSSGTGALLAAIRAQAAAERARSLFRRSLAWGRPVAEVEWERVPTIDGLDGFDAFGFQLVVPLPLGKRGRALRTQAMLDAEATEADQEYTLRTIEGRRAAAWAEAEAAEQSLVDLDELLDRMPATEYSLTEQFRLGAISYLVLIDGLSRLDEVRREAIKARHGWLVAHLELAVLADNRSLFPLPDLEVVP